jgi:hypothetical protein
VDAVVVGTFEAAAGLIHPEEDEAGAGSNHPEDEEEAGLIHPAEVGDEGEVDTFHQNQRSIQPCRHPEGLCQRRDRIQRVRKDRFYKRMIG